MEKPNSLKPMLAGTAAAILFATSLIMGFEGKSNTAYYDPPKVATICYGHTRGVTITDKATDKQCSVYLGDDVKDASDAVSRLVKVEIPVKTRAAFISFVFNAGAENFAKSTMLKKLNAGDVTEACKQLSKWVYSRGQKLPGLVKRRAVEQALCLEGME